MTGMGIERDFRKLASATQAELRRIALAEVLEDPTAPHMARIKAASALLDRGYGRPGLYIETRINPLDQLSDDELEVAIEWLGAAIAAGEGHA
jgi:hypothetical protein